MLVAIRDTPGRGCRIWRTRGAIVSRPRSGGNRWRRKRRSRQRRRQRHAELRGPRRERGQDARVELDTTRELFGTAAKARFTGQAHALEAGARRRCATCGGDLRGLAEEILMAAKERWVEN